MPKAFSSILKRDTGSRSVENAQVRISYKLDERLKYYEVSRRQELQVSRDRSKRIDLSIYLGFIHVKHVFIKRVQVGKDQEKAQSEKDSHSKALQTKKTRQCINFYLNQSILTFSKTCAF